MILYYLQCESGHQFEAWFLDSGTYDSQSVNGDVECPFCGDYHVSETPPPAVLKNEIEHSLAPSGRAHDIAEQILHAVEKLRGHVTDPMEEDGVDFPREARRVDCGGDHGLYGEAAEDGGEDLDEDAGGYYRLRPASRQED